MKKLMTLAALTILTACDYVNRADFSRERADRLYKAAMEDYRAGRLDAAIDGFRKVVRNDPSNASARFQLGCLLQDSKSDCLGAFCCYQEYLSQHPESDKARLAKDRLEKSEQALAKLLASKYGLSARDGFVRENEALKRDLGAAETRAATAEKESEALRLRVAALGGERERLLKIIREGEAGGAVAAVPPSVKEAKDLLEEDDGEGDRIKLSADAASLRAEADEELATRSDILPVGTSTVARVEKKVEPPHVVRNIPETYVVQEGDTLYGLSKRFYGRLTVWKKIRDMNKHLISADNRLHAGDTLKLPRE